MNRRTFAAAALATTITPWLATCACAKPARRGCSLALGQGDADVPALLSSCGVPALDDLCRSESLRLSSHFGVTPRFGFFDDAAAPNAYAAEAAANEPASVFFGIGLIQDIAASNADAAVLPIAAIMAHEWGHILQYENKAAANWGVRLELSADYLAGWYLAKTRTSDPQLLARIKEMFAGLGDTSFTDIDHHGTPRQRANIMLTGAGAYRLPDGRIPDGNTARTLDQDASTALKSSFALLR